MIGSDTLYLPVPWHSRDPLNSWISVEVVTDTAGAVVSAKVVPASGPEFTPENMAQAESLVRALHFTPFERNGHPVMARFERNVNLLPPEVKLARRVPFPKVKDWKTVKITLLRATPYGTDYTLAVYGDGTVVYRGYSNVAFTGRHRGSARSQNVAQLVKLFEQADFYSLRNEYSVHGEAFIRTISIEIDGRRNQIDEEDGLAVGMPLAVERLEDAIDRLSGSERWTQGNAQTLAALEAEHWDFKSQEAADTLARVSAFGNAQAVRDLVRVRDFDSMANAAAICSSIRPPVMRRWNPPPDMAIFPCFRCCSVRELPPTCKTLAGRWWWPASAVIPPCCRPCSIPALLKRKTWAALWWRPRVQEKLRCCTFCWRMAPA